MNGIAELVGKGGPVLVAILVLSVVLYSRCVKLLVWLRRSRLELAGLGPVSAGDLTALRSRVGEVNDSYRRQRLALGAMVTAAPLLGLLGTVRGMVSTFESLSGRSAEKTMEGLARGISEVLVATESGLVVAIPALLVIHVAHRELRKYLQSANRIERCVLAREKP
jgi:biopolymer transport protein ExbB